MDNYNGINTFEGLILRRCHQPYATGNKIATIGVLGMNLEIGGTTMPNTSINWLGFGFMAVAAVCTNDPRRRCEASHRRAEKDPPVLDKRRVTQTSQILIRYEHTRCH